MQDRASCRKDDLRLAHAGSGGTGGFEFGVDPHLDPELALALRMSLEDERARQAAAEMAAAAAPTATAAQTSTANTSAGAAASSSPEGAPTGHRDDGAAPMDEDDDADALLQQALAISMQVRCYMI
jgi:26S proteasome regulatory subunit N10